MSKNGVQAGDPLLNISDKPGKKLCDLPLEVLEKICVYRFRGELIESLTPSFRAPGSRPSFSCHLPPISPNRHAASKKYEAVCLPLTSGGDAEFLPWDAATSTNRDIAVANNWAGTRNLAAIRGTDNLQGQSHH